MAAGGRIPTVGREGGAALDHHAPTETGSRPSSFYASPTEALAAPAERFAYVSAMHTGTAVDAPDFIAVVDTDPGSPTYGTITHETPMPAVGDEFHHFGWNRCSSACHGPDRSHLIVPGFRSSRVYILDVAEDPRPAEAREGHRAGRVERRHRLQPAPHRPLHAGREHRDQHAR